MMREIEFKAKKINGREWVYGYYQKVSNIHYIRDKHDSRYPVIKETVGQFTGLYDKDKKKVFEGDILRHATNYEPYDCVIEWNKEDIGSCGCCYDSFSGSGFVGRVTKEKTKYDYSKYAGEYNKMEIIGNIHEELK